MQNFLSLYRRLRRDGGAPRRRLRAPPDRADRPAPPAAVRRPAGGRRAAAQPLAAGRARLRLDPARAARHDARLRSLPQRGRRLRASRSPTTRRPPAAGAVQVIALADVKGLEFDHVYLLGLDRALDAGRGACRARRWCRRELLGDAAAERRPRRLDGAPAPGAVRGDDPRPRQPRPLLGRGRAIGGRSGPPPSTRRRAPCSAATEERPRRGALRPRRGTARDLPDAARRGPRGVLAGGPRALGASPRHRDRRQPRDRPLPGAAEAGGAGAAPGGRGAAEAIEAVNGLLRQVATPEQQAELEASSLDEYLLDEERERGRRRELIAARRSPRWRPSCRGAATACASRRRTSTST